MRKATLKKLRTEERIRGKDRVVCVITDLGFKNLDMFESLPFLSIPDPIGLDWGEF